MVTVVLSLNRLSIISQKGSEMPQVVTCIIKCDGKILLLKRSNKVGTYRGLWGGVAGFVEENEEPFDTALKEIFEETGIRKDHVFLAARGHPIEFIDVYEGKTYEWTIYPFLFHLKNQEPVHIDWEHTEFRWIHPTEIGNYDTVPHLKEVVQELIKDNVWMGKRGGVVRRREKNKDNSPSSNNNITL